MLVLRIKEARVSNEFDDFGYTLPDGDRQRRAGQRRTSVEISGAVLDGVNPFTGEVALDHGQDAVVLTWDEYNSLRANGSPHSLESPSALKAKIETLETKIAELEARKLVVYESVF